MAKALKLTGMAKEDFGVRMEFSRLGETFRLDMDLPQASQVLVDLTRVVCAHGAAVRLNVDQIIFAKTPEADGAPPPLVVLGADGRLIALTLDWTQVTALSKLAEAMLHHAPTAGRPT